MRNLDNLDTHVHATARRPLAGAAQFAMAMSMVASAAFAALIALPAPAQAAPCEEIVLGSAHLTHRQIRHQRHPRQKRL